MLAEQEVSNQLLDMGLLAPTATATMETLGVERIEVGADPRACRAARLSARPDIHGRRREAVEHPFGTSNSG